jgi:hypothetical protein
MADSEPKRESEHAEGTVASPKAGPPTGESLPVGSVPRWAHRGPQNIPAWGDDGEEANEEGTRPGSAPTGSE